ncbi:uncharacterized protein LOC111368573 isoform X1 [Olea europaea var. sylvestris]|uniref:uncharacterized protein LOC111368573 isoform X1 n=1 Tax=Olea europaea var. sylvestris TaxID=158386 RepID=UPI000C1CE450|nr:uncharacterized protein LOC111368573 isoform X1 [Olea europaea var. sylvestris]
MPPKKKFKATASSSTTVFDRRRFISPEAKERYKQNVIHRNCIPERGLENFLPDKIHSLGWEKFTEQPTAVSIPLVKEFYVNANEHENFKVFVWAFWIKFGSFSINRFYHTQDIPNDDYSRLRDEGVDLDEIIRTIARLGAEWKRSASDVTHFPSFGLIPNCKIWHHFTSSKLIPSSNTSEVTKERALLNFVIQKGYSIDVGRVIQCC